jgi:hypothetical protein
MPPVNCKPPEGRKLIRPLKPKEHIKLTNQSLVFESFGEDEKLTIAELTHRVNTKLPDVKRLSEQTVRRAVNDLVQMGHLKPYGKSYNAQTFGKLSAATSNGDTPIIPYAGSSDGMSTVEEFLRVMTDPDLRPLKLKRNLIGEKQQHAIRRLMVFAILSAAESGHDETLKSANENLNEVLVDLQFAIDTIKSFVDSPIWYPQYRDRIAYAVRRVQEKDAELFQLAQDYVKGG